jgi:hypothetical protein
LFDSFEAYLKSRWDMSRSQAYRLIEAARIIDNLSPIGDTLPENEAQLRALVKLTPFDQRRIWRDFIGAGLELNAGNIQRFVSKYGNKEKARTDLTNIISAAYKQAVLTMLEQIRLAGQDGWSIELQLDSTSKLRQSLNFFISNETTRMSIFIDSTGQMGNALIQFDRLILRSEIG